MDAKAFKLHSHPVAAGGAPSTTGGVGNGGAAAASHSPVIAATAIEQQRLKNNFEKMLAYVKDTILDNFLY